MSQRQNMTGARCPHANLMDPALIADGMPVAAIRNIRDAGPTVRIDDPLTGIPFWAVTRKEAIDFVSNRTDLFSSALRGAPPMEQPQRTVDTILSRMFLNMDPPLNVEYRALIRDNFMPGIVAGYRERLEAVAKQVVDAVIERGECEFVEDIAAELPLITILELFDIPIDERRQFFDWTNRMFFADDPAYQYQTPPDAGLFRRTGDSIRRLFVSHYNRIHAMKAALEVIGYFKRLARHWRGRNEKNLCTQLLNGTVRGNPLSDDDFAWTCLMLVSAGNESTRTAITHGMRNLIENPAQYRALQDNPEKLDSAIDEMLRINTSFICMRRTATCDVTAAELGNVAIRKGDKVILYYPASNLDPSLFGDDAEQFDIDRPQRCPGFRQHLRSFGYGKHNCLGMHLARLEMKIQLGEILRRMDNPRFAGEISYIQSNFVQGIRSMPICFDKV